MRAHDAVVWAGADIAAEQLKVAQAELRQGWRNVEPLRVFGDIAARLVADGAVTLWDYGCGPAHYSVVWRESGGQKYEGYDGNTDMRTVNNVCLCDRWMPDRTLTDVLLFSQSIEFADSPMAKLAYDIQGRHTTVLHRAMIREGAGHWDMHETYLGRTCSRWTWGRVELAELLTGFDVREVPWDNGQKCTLVIRRRARA